MKSIFCLSFYDLLVLFDADLSTPFFQLKINLPIAVVEMLLHFLLPIFGLANVGPANCSLDQSY
jgi:hypothetical protein